MVRKIYAYPGISSGDILLKVGMKGHVRVPFKNGYLDKKLSRPATYVTADPVMQQIIENSDLFGRRIFLQHSFGDEPEVQDVAGNYDPVVAADEPAKKVVEYPDVTSYEEAVAVLKTIPGVKASSLRSAESARKVALANSIAFPNYPAE